MTDRVELIIRKILGALHDQPTGMCPTGLLKASVDLQIRPNALQSEWDEAIAKAEELGLVTGIRPALGKVKWAITDPGRAVHLQNLSDSRA